MKLFGRALASLLLAAGLAACSMHGVAPVTTLSGDSSGSGALQPLDTHGGIANSSMTVTMGDAPPSLGGKQLEHLDLAILGIDVTDSHGGTHTIARYDEPLIVDVLQYQDGNGAGVGNGKVDGQTYDQIRFLIDGNASHAVYADGSSADLLFESGGRDESSNDAGDATTTRSAGDGRYVITVREPFTIRPNAADLVGVDFNAFESLAPAGGGGRSTESVRSQSVTAPSDGGPLLVRPTLYTAAAWNAGKISGTIVNRDGNPVSGAVIVACDTHGGIANASVTDASGAFELHTLPAGSYQLFVFNTYTNAAGALYQASGATSLEARIPGPSVDVRAGQTTFAGSISD